MAAKIQLKNGNIGNFGGIFSTFDSFDKIGLSELIDNSLETRDIRAKYSYSDIIKNLTAIYFSGGDAIEDINIFRNETYTRNPEYRFCSADTILKSFTELQVGNDTVESKSGKKYQFNINEKLNELLFECMLKCNLVKAGDSVTLDYDNQFIPTEKLDATYSYKKAAGYFPGIAQVNYHPCHIECRDGNANVKLDQAKTMERIYKQLKGHKITVDKTRLDCGSYVEEVVKVVAANSKWFYIRASQCQSLHRRFEDEIADSQWVDAEIDCQRCQLASLPFTAFLSERNYRLVVQRTLVPAEEPTLFDSYVHRCILTNDWEGSEEEIVLFYNQRGCSEQTFDVMNNDFGWSHLPCSEMGRNTVFMIFAAIARNFYVSFLKGVASLDAFRLRETSRVKKFVFRFMSVPFKWVRRGRQWLLTLYSAKPYDKLLL